jgi:hypothetical protein
VRENAALIPDLSRLAAEQRRATRRLDSGRARESCPTLGAYGSKDPPETSLAARADDRRQPHRMFNDSERFEGGTPLPARDTASYDATPMIADRLSTSMRLDGVPTRSRPAFPSQSAFLVVRHAAVDSETLHSCSGRTHSQTAWRVVSERSLAPTPHGMGTSDT